MAKPRPAPTKSADDFATWLQDALPDDVYAYFHVERSFHRERGRKSESVEYWLHLHRGAGKHSTGLDQRTHDLAILARWINAVAIPHMFPPPPKPQPRRLGDHGRQIEHKTARRIAYDPPEELLFG